MDKVTITIETGNAAFQDDPSVLKKILQEATYRICNDTAQERPKLFDYNGNHVGTIVVE